MNLDNRLRELIAVGASVTANCQPCLQYHRSKAVESGANEHEIAEAIEIGRLVRKGAASNMDRFASQLNQAVVVEQSFAGDGCGCTGPKGA